MTQLTCFIISIFSRYTIGTWKGEIGAHCYIRKKTNSVIAATYPRQSYSDLSNQIILQFQWIHCWPTHKCTAPHFSQFNKPPRRNRLPRHADQVGKWDGLTKMSHDSDTPYRRKNPPPNPDMRRETPTSPDCDSTANTSSNDCEQRRPTDRDSKLVDNELLSSDSGIEHHNQLGSSYHDEKKQCNAPTPSNANKDDPAMKKHKSVPYNDDDPAMKKYKATMKHRRRSC